MRDAGRIDGGKAGLRIDDEGQRDSTVTSGFAGCGECSSSCRIKNPSSIMVGKLIGAQCDGFGELDVLENGQIDGDRAVATCGSGELVGDSLGSGVRLAIPDKFATHGGVDSLAK